jgi:ABC-2 type transport system ATP-binding protein
VPIRPHPDAATLRSASSLPTLRDVAAVEVTSLAKRYGSTVAVADVSLQAAAGQITAILGPNGAGKTTTVEICAGLRAADSGSVAILGLDPRRDSAKLSSRVGIMPQGGSTASGVYPSARVAEVLHLYAALHAHPLPAEPLLERLGLEKVARTPWRGLSGGEQQRLSLALSLVGRPELLFLDEPTAGLDVQGRHATWELIGELKSAGVAIVLTTHAIDEAAQLADAIVIVDAGRVVAAGSPASLTEAVAGSRQLRFDAAPALPISDLLGTLPPHTSATETAAGHYVVTGEITPNLAAAVTAWCASHDVIPERMTTGARTLEDVFLTLTGKELRS